MIWAADEGDTSQTKAAAASIASSARRTGFWWDAGIQDPFGDTHQSSPVKAARAIRFVCSVGRYLRFRLGGRRIAPARRKTSRLVRPK
jgi:hypothetical protein